MPKHCFLDPRRPCTLECKAAFEIDDPHDPVDCTFLWLAQNLGESVWSLKEALENDRPKPGGKKGPSLDLN